MTTFACAKPSHKSAPQWAIWPFVQSPGQIGNAPPLVLIGMLGIEGLGYANTVARELRARGIRCYVDVI